MTTAQRVLAKWDAEQRALGRDPEIIGAHEYPPLCCPSCQRALPWKLIIGYVGQPKPEARRPQARAATDRMNEALARLYLRQFWAPHSFSLSPGDYAKFKSTKFVKAEPLTHMGFPVREATTRPARPSGRVRSYLYCSVRGRKVDLPAE